MASRLFYKAKSKAQRISATAIYRLAGRWDNDFDPIFICGASGSGTSLITALLDQNYEVCGAARESARAVDSNSSLYVNATDTYAHVNDFLRALYFPNDISANTIRADCLDLYRRIVRHPKRTSSLLDKAANSHLVRAGQLAVGFPSAKFVFVLRSPITTIEGLQRKWGLFRNASLDDLCAFWRQIHDVFLKQSTVFSERVIGISYENLVQDSNSATSTVAEWIGLAPRANKFFYQDQINKAGRGLRNVVSGEVIIDKSAEQESLQRMPAADQELIKTRVWKTYENLLRIIER